MSRLDALPPDQRATLSLLLSQHKSYAEVAALLSIPEQAVHDRAQAALAVLAPREARELSSERREAIGDYLLGQQTGVAERLAARTYLDGSPDGRAWAQAIADEIAPLSNGALPEIPAGADTPPADPPARASVAQGDGNAPAPPPGRGRQPSSRVGGAILLAVIVVGVIVAVVLLAGGGGGSKGASAGASGKTSTTSKSSTAPNASPASGTSGTGPTVDQRLTLTSPDPSSKAVGEVEILSEASKTAFYLAAEHLPPTKGFFYAVWLYNSPSSHEALSKSPPVGADGTLQGGALLPANAGDYHQILVTRETSDRPTHPGPIVLSGPFSLGK